VEASPEFVNRYAGQGNGPFCPATQVSSDLKCQLSPKAADFARCSKSAAIYLGYSAHSANVTADGDLIVAKIVFCGLKSSLLADPHLDRVEPIAKKMVGRTSGQMQYLRLRAMDSHGGVVSIGALTPNRLG
jgi:hypothetical protein